MAEAAGAADKSILVWSCAMQARFGGCPANVSACCDLLARDGIHTTPAGAVAIAGAAPAGLF